ncbi:MAG: hypothetical protein KKE20_04070 [Nanoarchaeota archaeon]|nr:hypothetical protein [Nanoarchaeota archaeon]
MELIQIYQIFHKAYGPQGWWPLSKGRNQTKHHSGPPSDSHDRWEIIVGAVLTQNTSWTNVEKAIENLNRAKLMDRDNLRKATVWKISELIKPSGYFRQKAERLKIIADYFSMHLKEGTIPAREELLKVKGIGPETADSILLYAFDQPYFVVDAYTRRIFSRLGLIDKDASYDKIQGFFMENLKEFRGKKKIEMFKEYHALIVEHAKRHCRTKAECGGCILKNQCRNAS